MTGKQRLLRLLRLVLLSNRNGRRCPRSAGGMQQSPTKATAKPGTSTARMTNKRVIIGRATDLSIKAAKRFANVFVSHLDTDVSESLLNRYLESTLKLDVTVELCRLSSSQSSFHLTCVCPEPNVFVAEDLWADGTYVRWWRQPKQATNPDSSQLNPVSTTAVNTTVVFMSIARPPFRVTIFSCPLCVVSYRLLCLFGLCSHTSWMRRQA